MSNPALDETGIGCHIVSNLKFQHLAETRNKLSRAKIGLEFEGFRASIRLLPAGEQAQRLRAKLKKVYGSDLNIHGMRVSGLSPLEGMKLEEFCFVPKNITKGIEIIRGMKSFRGIGYESKVRPGRTDA